ncbi:alpha/beta hydrolase [Roseicyclus mahoneyensis]|uniref:Serine aminopeptidase S33 family n=1 Tax=Roseicyclus mahoneyensis TaxID=164332 RepID=A0A316GM34_9RHOB|nr:alpha/beta fold hydrolase [Roseicyclus mahoneyensis]PWK61626.1 serine aminopeptidase S33 family [Roseicyclus mahoneyensis]
MRQAIVAGIAVLCIALGLWGLEAPRSGLAISHDRVGDTPVTVMRLPDAQGPVAVIAHGFAGSRQLMAAWQLSLARAGFITVSFDFEGHGRNPVPMSGDVTSIDGTTRLLMEETARVTDYATALPGAEPRVALVGHSMASDVVVRQGLADDRVAAIVGISIFSQAVTSEEPRNLLMLNGAWEGALRTEAQRVMAELGVGEGETVGTPGDGFARRAEAVPLVEHVGVLYAPSGIAAGIDWIAASFGLVPQAGLVSLGPWILLTLSGVVLLVWPLARLLPEGRAPWHPGRMQFWAMAVLPAVLTPGLLSLFETRFLPVLVADYLALHLALYGALVLAGAAWAGGLPARRGLLLGLGLAVYGIVVFGGVMDRYVGSFFPHPGRAVVMLAILPGAVLAMLADAVLLEAARAALWRRIVARGMFLISLGIAVALDFERLFFLIIILPVIGLFYLSYGMMGRFVGKRTGSAVAMGVGMGVILGWALGVTFPMFDPGV